MKFYPPRVALIIITIASLFGCATYSSHNKNYASLTSWSDKENSYFISSVFIKFDNKELKPSIFKNSFNTTYHVPSGKYIIEASISYKDAKEDFYWTSKLKERVSLAPNKTYRVKGEKVGECLKASIVDSKGIPAVQPKLITMSPSLRSNTKTDLQKFYQLMKKSVSARCDLKNITNDIQDPYIISNTQNDIKDKKPEVWDFILNLGKRAKNEARIEKETVNFENEVSRALEKTKNKDYQLKIKPLIGTWKDCIRYRIKDPETNSWLPASQSNLRTFKTNGTFTNQFVRHADTRCKDNSKFSSAWGNYTGYFYIGKKLNIGSSGSTYELNEIIVRDKDIGGLNEEQVYFSLVNINENTILFGSRNGKRKKLSPSSRAIKLDKAKFKYTKVK